MSSSSPQYTFDLFTFEPEEFQLSAGEERVTLPSSLNKLLLLFVTRPGRLVTRAEIAEAIWETHATIDVENGINSIIRRLRTQLQTLAGANAAGEEYLQTVVGAGYRFLPEVVPIASPDTESPGELVPVTEGEPAPGVRAGHGVRRRTQAWLWPALAAGCVLLAGAGWRWHDRSNGGIVFTAGSADAVPALEAVSDWEPLSTMSLDEDLQAQSLSPSGKQVALMSRSGLQVQATRTAGSPAGPAESVLPPTLRSLRLPSALQVSWLSWLPDEARLLVSGTSPVGTAPQGRAQVWVVPVDGGAPLLWADDAEMATVSPDGRRVLYTRGAQTELWLADIAGHNARRIVTPKPMSTIAAVVWAPGSNYLAVSRDTREAQPVQAEKGALEQLKAQDHWRYETYNAGVRPQQPEGSLLAQQDGVSFRTAALTANGRLIYPVEQAGKLQIAVAAVDRSTGAFLAEPAYVKSPNHTITVRSLTLSADGTKLSLLLDRKSDDVYLADLHTGPGNQPSLSNVRLFTYRGRTSYPTGWSPSGDRLVFDEGERQSSIVSQALNGGHVTMLADTGGRSVQGQYTPDGKWILFLRYEGEPTHVDSVQRVRPEGGPLELVYRSSGLLDFHCSRSAFGRCVMRERNGGQVVYSALDAMTGRGEELVRIPLAADVLGDWSLSPDGLTVATADHDDLHPGVSLISLPGSRRALPLRIAVAGNGTVLGPSWAADGKGLFVQTHLESEFRLLYVGVNGETTPLLKSSTPIWGVTTRDGKRIAFPKETPLNRNVWFGTIPSITK